MSSTPTTIIVASGNRHKILELETLLQEHLNVELIPMSDVIGNVEIDETGTTFAENAYIKASYVHSLTGLPVIADDSGLIVDSLDGEPGVFSARYAGPLAKDADNRLKVSENLSQRGVDTSAGRFSCVLCYIDAQRTVMSEGIVEGTVHSKATGEGGFGYDPMFVPDGHDLTYGQLPQSVKDATSHRSQAASALATRLQQLSSDDQSHEAAPRVHLDAVYRASIYAVQADEQRLRNLFDSWIIDHIDARAAYEAMLQTYLFAGFPTAIESLSLLHEVCTAKGIVLQHESSHEYNVEEFSNKGRALCSRVYGSVFDKMMQRFNAISPDMQSWMIIEGYGKTLSRPGLDELTRECAIICMLATLGRKAQLYSHVRGARNLGATSEHLETCAHAIIECAGATAHEMFEEVLGTRY